MPVCSLDFSRDDAPDAFWGTIAAASGAGLPPLPAASRDLERVLAAAIAPMLPREAPTRAAAKRLRALILERESLTAACETIRDAALAYSSGSLPSPVTSPRAAEVPKGSGSAAEDELRPAGFSFNHRGLATDSDAPHSWRKGDDSSFRVCFLLLSLSSFCFV